MVPSLYLEKGPTFPEHVGICVVSGQTWGSISKKEEENDCRVGN